MPAIDITEWVKKEKRHSYYKESVQNYNDMLVHSDGVYPEKLIGGRRPAESITIKNYRKEIYSAITMPYFSKVQTSLGKIRKSVDYAIQFDPDDVPPSIAEEETLQYYTTENYPKFRSLDNWFWSVCFKNLLVDPNAVTLTMITNPIRDEVDYAKPYPTIFNSHNIWDYKENEFYFLKSSESYYFQEGKTLKEGAVFYFVDRYNTDRYEQIDTKGNYRYIPTVHGLGYLPIVKLHGVIAKDNLYNTLCNSRLISMLPELNEAVREYSDLQAEVVQHVHSLMWAINSNKCTTCKGNGQVKTKDQPAIVCPSCKGKGSPPFNPYENINVKVDGADVNNPPTPPAGYILKDIEIAKLQDVRVQDHVYRGLSAINFEFLMNTPLNQSGTAKEVDKSELNTFVYSVAEDSIRVIDEHFVICNDMRYSVIVPDKNVREDMLPKIEVPMRYDIVTDQMMLADIQTMKTAKLNPKIIAAAETNFVGKTFITDQDLKESVLAIFDLDPFSGTAEEEVTQQFSNGGISKTDYSIHCNIKKFIEIAIEENPEFLDLPMKDKREKMEQLATDEIKKESVATDVMNQITAVQQMKLDANKNPIDNAAANN